jgi:geranylgeranyl reductase family protein
MNYDVIVVGSGPAGAVVSYELARQGIKVLIIEKSKLPRYKPCGGGITKKTLDELPIGIQSAIEVESKGGIFSFGGKQLFKINIQRTVAWLVMRDSFDYFLVQKALEAGASLMDSTRVLTVDQRDKDITISTNKGKYQSQILVGADGVNSIIARSLNLIHNRKTGVAIEAEVSVPLEKLKEQGAYATFDFGALPNGYGWIFPKKDHLSIGVFHAKNGKLPSIRNYLHMFIESHHVLAKHEFLNIRGHRIPLGDHHTGTLHTQRAILVGDAANLADPWLGEGIYYAVLSARIASKVIINSLDKDIARINEYSHIIFRDIGKQFDQARRLARLTYRFPRLCSNLLKNSPDLQEIVFGTMRGDYKFQHTNLSLLKKFPRILLQSLQ